MEAKIFNFETPLKSPKVAVAAAQSAQPTSESAKPIATAPAALENLESAKLTSKLAEPTPTIPSASEVASDDFASSVAALVGMKVPKVPNDEMVDY